MTTFIALLRAVNVGGTGKLSMAELKALCKALGHGRVETYIASGNVVFDSDLAAARVQAGLEESLQAHVGKPVGVFVRTADEMRRVLQAHPFADADPRLTYAIFLREKPAASALDDLRGQDGEQLALGSREIYVFYPAGMGQSKLVLKAARDGTARNLNTVAKLVAMCDRG